MDAVGVDAVLIAESRGFDPKCDRRLVRSCPTAPFVLSFRFRNAPSPCIRTASDISFASTSTIPSSDGLVAEVRTKPGALCLRIVPIPIPGTLPASNGVSSSRCSRPPRIRRADLRVSARPGRMLVPLFEEVPQAAGHPRPLGVGVEPPQMAPYATTLASSMIPHSRSASPS